MIDPKLEEAIVPIFSELVQIDSSNPGGSEAAVAQKILRSLSKLGCSVPESCVRILKHCDKRSSMVITLPGERDDIVVGFAGHLDTVPLGEAAQWKWPPLSGHVDEHNVWGRGTVDMKSGITAMLLLYASYVIQDKKPPVTLRFFYTSDEESHGIGAQALNDAGVFDGLAFLFICEPTACSPGICEKGCLWTTFDLDGIASHASMPNNGVNALSHGFALVQQVQNRIENMQPEHFLLGKNTCELTSAVGGKKINVIPNFAHMTVDIRFLPQVSPKEIEELITQSICEQEASTSGLNIKVSYENCRIAVEVDTELNSVRAAIDACRQEGVPSTPSGVLFYTDGSIVLSKHPDMPFLILGPGDPTQCHKINEHIDWREISHALHIYRRWVDTSAAWL